MVDCIWHVSRCGAIIARMVRDNEKPARLWAVVLMAILTAGVVAACGGVGAMPPDYVGDASDDDQRADQRTDEDEEQAAEPVLRELASGLAAPVALEQIESGGPILVADQAGLLYVLDPEHGLHSDPFLDLRSRMVELRPGFDERGLLGLALHPQFPEDPRVFLYYSAPLRSEGPDGWDHSSSVSAFELQYDGEGTVQVDPESEQVIIKIDQPQFNHNAGVLRFGPDGYLYIALGDGGLGNDQGPGHPERGHGQDISTLKGSILRIDVDRDRPDGQGYAIPEDNPFVGKPGARDEIYAYGLRNPWGMAFDRETGRLFAADVGQELFEEANIIEAGGNYGWNLREGLHCFSPDSPRDPPADCAETGYRGEPLIDPILEYRNYRSFPDEPDAYGVSIIGGMVYRGSQLPQLRGRYVFGDWATTPRSGEGRLLIAEPAEDDSEPWTIEPLAVDGVEDGTIGTHIFAFGEDLDGELYVLVNDTVGPSGEGGRVLRLEVKR